PSQSDFLPPPPLPTDLGELVPPPYGFLEHGLASPVVEFAKLLGHSQERRYLFEQLKGMIADTSSDRARTAWFFETIEDSTFVIYKHSKLLLNTSSDAKVYLGGCLMGEYASHERDMIRSYFAYYAQPVAIKQYFEKESKIEINPFHMLPRGTDGIINYMASFDVGGVEMYTVQELGLVSVDKMLPELSLEEQLKMVRGACLSIRELHKRPGGPIVHRDIRTPNFLLSDTGCIKVCDFGISRILPDVLPLRSQGGVMSLTSLSYQPYEVQVAAQRVAEEREQSAMSLLSSNDFSFYDQEFSSNVPVTTSGDIFMLGLVLYKLVNKVDAMSNSDIVNKRAPDLSMIIRLFAGGEMLAHLLSSMLSHEAAKRPSIDQVLEHPFFKSWNENALYVQGLYRELHDAEGVRYTENFKVLEMVLQPLEQQANWKTCLQNLPAHLRSRIVGNKDIPPVLLPEGAGSKPHPLPNLHEALQYLLYFFVHFRDHKIFPYMYSELRTVLREHEAAGEFVYAHPSLSWVLPKFWETKLFYMQHLQNEQQVWEKEWAMMQRKNEEVRSSLRMKERKVKSLLGSVV
ncbi:protein kinase family protein, partial [archaeon]